MVPSSLCSITASGAPSRTGRSGASATAGALRESSGIAFLAASIVVVATTWATPSDRSSLLHFRRALLEEGLETRLGLRVGLRDGGGQRFHGVAGGRVAL